jgi:hypothetical protein
VAVAGYLSRFWALPDGAPLTPVDLCGIPHKPLDLLTPWLVDRMLDFTSICVESAPAHQTSIQCSLSCRLTNFLIQGELHELGNHTVDRAYIDADWSHSKLVA